MEVKVTVECDKYILSESVFLNSA